MAAVPQKTLNWLWDVLRREYRDPQRTYSDLAQTLSRFPDFSPRTDVYTYENGAPALLVHIVGVVPVTFRGSTYRFPIALWVPHAYPYEAPIVYVTPTDDMVVRPGQHVSGDGRVYHHYLAHWREAWDRSNVVDFLSILSDIFAKEPPVISKQQAQRQPPPPQQQHQPAPPPRPPLPGEAQRQSSQPHRRPPSQYGAPPPPPKQPTDHEGRTSSQSQTRPGRYDAPPPLPGQVQRPPRPPSIQDQYAQGSGNIPQPSRQSQYLPPRGSSLREGQPPQQWPGQLGRPPSQVYPPQHLQQMHPHEHPQPLPYQHESYQHPHPQAPPYQPPNQQHPHSHPPDQPHPQPPHHPHHLQHHQPPPQALQYHPQSQAPPQQQTPKPKAPQQDLLSSPFDISLPVSRTPLPAPPIPRNPEKDALLAHLSSVLTSTLHNSIQQSNTAIGPLQSQNAALQNTLATLNDEIYQLQHLQEGLNGNISLLRTSLANADTSIANAKHRAQAGDVPKVDDMLIAPHVASRQLYDVVTEERGIDAAIFALQEAFVRGRVSSEVWGRRTRELAREGFRKRYLGKRIGGGMGLEM